MKKLNLDQIESITGGADCQTSVGGSAGMMLFGMGLLVAGITTGGAALVLGGALYGYVTTLDC